MIFTVVACTLANDNINQGALKQKSPVDKMKRKKRKEKNERKEIIIIIIIKNTETKLIENNRKVCVEIKLWQIRVGPSSHQFVIHPFSL